MTTPSRLLLRAAAIRIVALATAVTGFASLPQGAWADAGAAAAVASDVVGTSAISGFVTDSQNERVGDVEIYVRATWSDDDWRLATTADAAGTWRIDGLAAGTYNLYARAVGDSAPTSPKSAEQLDGSRVDTVTVEEGQEAQFRTLQFFDWAHLAGRVVIPSKYRDSASVSVRLTSGGSSTTFPVASDGRWAIRRLTQAWNLRLVQQVSITVGGEVHSSSVSQTIDVASGQKTLPEAVFSVLEYDVHAPKTSGNFAAGKVERWNSETQSWSGVSVLMPDDLDRPQAWVTSQAGRYRFSLLPHQIGPAGKSSLVAAPVVVDVAPGEAVTLPDFSYGAARGTLTFPSKAGRISEIEYEQWRPDEKRWVWIDRVPVAANGTFDLGPLPIGRYRTVARVPAEVAREFTVGARRETRVAWTEQPRAVRITGKGLRITTPGRARTGLQLQATHRFPTSGSPAVAGLGIQYEWWSRTKITRGPKKGTWRKPVRVKGAVGRDSTFVPSAKFRGRQVRVRIIADSPLHRRTVFTSAWTKPLR